MYRSTRRMCGPHEQASVSFWGNSDCFLRLKLSNLTRIVVWNEEIESTNFTRKLAVKYCLYNCRNGTEGKAHTRVDKPKTCRCSKRPCFSSGLSRWIL